MRKLARASWTSLRYDSPMQMTLIGCGIASLALSGCNRKETALPAGLVVDESSAGRFIGVPDSYGNVEILVPAAFQRNYVEDYAVEGDLVIGDLKSVDPTQSALHLFFILRGQSRMVMEYGTYDEWKEALASLGVAVAEDDARWR